MNIQSVDNTYSIQTNSLTQIESAQGCIVTCEAGTLLVTQPGFNRDYVLSQGENLRLDTNKRVLVGGGSDARFRLAPSHVASRYPNLIQGEHFANFL